MRDALEFGVKSFFAGCLGCLGAITITVVVVLGFGLVFKSKIQNVQTDITDSLQSIPEALSHGPPGMAGQQPGTGSEEPGMEEEASQQPAPKDNPSLFIFLTAGENPEGQKVNTFTRDQAKNVAIWVQSPPETQVPFRLELTIPDGTNYPFGEEYKSDPSGKPVMCGKLDAPDPPTGTYTLKAFPGNSPDPTGAMQFTITE